MVAVTKAIQPHQMICLAGQMERYMQRFFYKIQSRLDIGFVSETGYNVNVSLGIQGNYPTEVN